MCLAIYIASDVPLPLVPWDQNRPAFNVTDLDERHASVRKHFSKPYVYYVGAHTQCSCGFERTISVANSLDELEKAYTSALNHDGEVAIDDPTARESRGQLARYLRESLASQSVIQLYACWDGEEDREPEHRDQIDPEEIIEHTRFLGINYFEPEYLTIIRKR